MDERAHPSQEHCTRRLLSALGAACVFGLSVVCKKAGIMRASALTLLGWRFLVSFTVMALLIRLGVVRTNLRAKPLGGLLAIAFFAPGLYLIAEGKGLRLATAVEGRRSWA